MLPWQPNGLVAHSRQVLPTCFWDRRRTLSPCYTGMAVGTCTACPPENNALLVKVSRSDNNPNRAYVGCGAPMEKKHQNFFWLEPKPQDGLDAVTSLAPPPPVKAVPYSLATGVLQFVLSSPCLCLLSADGPGYVLVVTNDTAVSFVSHTVVKLRKPEHPCVVTSIGVPALEFEDDGLALNGAESTVTLARPVVVVLSKEDVAVCGAIVCLST